MRILVAPDKFKGSLGASEVAEQIAAGLQDVLHETEITILPVADGGEGTAEVICTAAGGEWHSCEVHDPLGRIVCARYCMIDNGGTALMEMSEASGLWRVPLEHRAPTRTSSFGTGELLLQAAKSGAKKIIIGLGGSATNDGGFGMARALGFRFLEASGSELIGAVPALRGLARIVPPHRLRLPPITAAADVANPFLGANGATRIFGPQKGATASQCELLERALERLASVVASDLGIEAGEVPGAGAAGGLGFGLMSFCGASIRSGFDVVAERIGLEKAVRNADVVITGEGRLDAQTLQGKAPAGVARLARRLGKQVYAIVGEVETTPELRAIFEEIVVLRTEGMPGPSALQNTGGRLRDGARQLARMLR